ncbi:MAG: sulfite exporter TauE/SafE family protein [Alphaproteobacteria bacterium]|nr:sulfite exporter TauE/SafE family protein [Alphaproteobacteria bacterium]
MIEGPWLPALAMFAGAVLYSSVGHAGASAYIAIMALFGFPPAVMRPTALSLNVLVASLASWRFARAGLFRWRVLWPPLLGAVPMAFIGGTISLPGHWYRPLVGGVLLIAALRFLWPVREGAARPTVDPPIPLGIAAGATIGLLSGLTGTGGGIFLSPLILLMGWAQTRVASGVAAVFILCNSAAGLLGNVAALKSLPADLPIYAAAVLAGALIGTTLGINWRPVLIQRALGVVLIVAGLKLIGVY